MKTSAFSEYFVLTFISLYIKGPTTSQPNWQVNWHTTAKTNETETEVWLIFSMQMYIFHNTVWFYSIGHGNVILFISKAYVLWLIVLLYVYFSNFILLVKVDLIYKAGAVWGCSLWNMIMHLIFKSRNKGNHYPLILHRKRNNETVIKWSQPYGTAPVIEC